MLVTTLCLNSYDFNITAEAGMQSTKPYIGQKSIANANIHMNIIRRYMYMLYSYIYVNKSLCKTHKNLVLLTT